MFVCEDILERYFECGLDCTPTFSYLCVIRESRYTHLDSCEDEEHQARADGEFSRAASTGPKARCVSPYHESATSKQSDSHLQAVAVLHRLGVVVVPTVLASMIERRRWGGRAACALNVGGHG